MLPATQEKIFADVRHFYEWAKMAHGGEWRRVSLPWVNSLRLKRSIANASKEKKGHQFWELADVLKIANYFPKTLHEERIRAAICFLYLSGMRVTAFCSLPAACVDIEQGRVDQKPSKGVITKNRKAAATFLLPIPELLEVVTAWDRKINQAGAPLWFPALEVGINGGWVLSPYKTESPAGRRTTLYTALGTMCENVGVPKLSPHKLRHGHGVYGVRNAKTVEDFKALSQNMMHANMGITDGLYGVLPEENVKRVLATFRQEAAQASHSTPNTGSLPADLPPELLQLARILLAQMGELTKKQE